MYVPDMNSVIFYGILAAKTSWESPPPQIQRYCPFASLCSRRGNLGSGTIYAICIASTRLASMSCGTTDRQLLHNNSRTRADLFRFDLTINDENRFEVFSFFRLSAIALKKSKRRTVSQTFTCVFNVLQASTTLHRQTP